MPDTPQPPQPNIIINEQDEIQHILGHPPNWILRWGISLVFVSVMIFLLLSWLIKYPDIIPAKVMLISEQPAIRMVANQSGKIEQLFVEDKQEVKAGEILAIIDNTAEWSAIQRLEQLLTEAEGIDSPSGWGKLAVEDDLAIGNLKGGYAAFLQKLRDYRYFIRQSDVEEKIASLEAQMKRLEELDEVMKDEKVMMEEELKIAQGNRKRMVQLKAEKVASATDAEAAKTNVLQAERQIKSQEAQMLNAKIRIEQIKNQIIDLRQGRSDGKANRELALRNDLQSLSAQVESWKQSFLLQAAISGQVSMAKVWSSQQFVNINEEVFTIVPSEGRGRIVGRAYLPISNSGKVEPEMRANIRLDGYPYQEYGVIRATVKSSSLVPSENTYLLEIELPNALVTTYDEPIPFRQEMQGVANIITEDRRIITRIFDKVLSILKNT
ncbi:MAG: HlyD family efflux transporter periplasmic adaptor subunit [Bacteroidota bacterium]